MKQPNVLFLFADDQRFDTLHAWGNPAIQTPNLDRLAARGLSFRQACIPGGTSGAVCMPSRAMLHTGRTLFRIRREGQEIAPDHALLGETLRAAGYQTFGTGKWHNGPAAYARSFTDGAEIMFGGMADHWNVPVNRFDPTGQYDARCPFVPDPFTGNALKYRHADHIPAGVHSTDLFAAAAEGFLARRDRARPFFLYLSFMAPHDPRTMPERFRNLYDPARIDLPPNFAGGHPFDTGDLRGRDEVLAAFPRDPAEIRRHIAEYYAMITHLDDAVGRVLQAQAAHDDGRETIVVFAADNGLALGQHGLMGKQNLYDHSLRVPLIIAGPGVPAGAQTDAWAFLSDLFPTLCEMTGTATPPSVEGRSLVPAFTAPAWSPRRDRYLAFCGSLRGCRHGDWKLIETATDGGRHTQLFNLRDDPWEREDLSTRPAHAATLRALRRRLERLRDASGDLDTPHGRTFWQRVSAAAPAHPRRRVRPAGHRRAAPAGAARPPKGRAGGSRAPAPASRARA